MRATNPFAAACAVLLLLLTHLSAIAQTVTWTGGGDGTSWTQSANWSPLGVPGPTADVVIPAGASAVTLSTAASVHSLTLSRALNISGSCSSLTLTAGLNLATPQGVLTTAQSSCDSLVFNGTQSISGPGRIALKSGAMRVTGAGAELSIAAGTTVTNAGASIGTITMNSGTSLVNGGAITASGNGGSVTINGPTLTNSPGGVLQALSSATLTIATTSWANQGQLVVNAGTARISAPTSSLGTIVRTGGTLELAGPYTSATLTADTTTGAINMGTGFTATGVTFATTGTGALVVTGGATWNNCTLASAVTMSTSCGLLTVTGGLTLIPGATLTTGLTDCEQLRFSGVQAISGSGEIRLSLGRARVFGTSAALTVSPGITLRTDTAAGSADRTITLDAGTTLINQGTISTSNGKNLNIGNLPQSPSGTFVNQPGGVVSGVSQGAVVLAVASWTNSGTFVFNQSSMTLCGTYSTFGNVTSTNAALRLYGNFQSGPNLTIPAGWSYEFNCPLTGVTINTDSGASYSIRSGTLANCTLNGTSIVSISGGTLTNCTFNAPVLTTGTVTLTAPVFNAPATLGESSIAGGITVNGVTLTKGNGYTRFNGGTQTISGNGTLVGIPAVVGDNTTLLIPATITLSADTTDLYISIGRNAHLDSSAAIHASGHAVGIGEGYTNGVGEFINRGTITLVNGASLSFQFNLRWINLGVISTASGVNLNLGGTYSDLGTIDQSAGAPSITLAGNFAVSGPLDIDTFSPSTVFATSLTGVTINSTSGRTFTANLGSSFTDCTFNTPVTIGGTSGTSVSFTNVHFYRPVTMGGTGSGQADFRGTITLHDIDVYLNNFVWSTFDTCLITGTGIFHSNGGSIIGQGTSLTIDAGITFRAEPGGQVYGAQSPVTFRGLAHGHAPTGWLGLGGNPLTLTGRAEVSDGPSLTLFNPVNTGSISMLRGSNLILNGTYPSLGVLERDASRTGNLTFNGAFNPGPTFVLTPNMMPAVFMCNASGVAFSATEGQTYTINGGSWSNCRWNAPVTFGGPNLQTAVTTLDSAIFDADATVGQMNIVTSRFGLTLLNQHSFTLKDNAEMTFVESSIQGNGSILFGPGLSSLRPENGQITIGAGITITNQGGDGRIRAGGGSPAYINNGTVRSSGTGRSITIDYVSPNPVFANYGTLQADAGSLLVQKFSVDNFGLIRVMPGGTYIIEAGAYLRMNPGATLETQLDGFTPAFTTPPVTIRGRLIAGGTFAITYPTGVLQPCQTTRTLVGTQGAGTFEGSFSTIQPPPNQGIVPPLVRQAGTEISYTRLSRADVGSAGAVVGADGLLNNDDFIVFINLYFTLNTRADVGSAGGIVGSDGLFDNNDFIAFISLFFTGCGE